MTHTTEAGGMEAVKAALDYFRPHPSTSGPVMLTPDKMRAHLAVIEAALATARPDESLERLRKLADRLEGHSWSINDGITGEIAEELRALSRPSQRAGVAEGHVERVRHIKRGTEYAVIGEAEAQISTAIGDTDRFGKWRGLYEGDKLTVYRCVETGKLWCRFTDEFHDGRFVPLDRAAAPQSQEAE